MAFDFSWGNLIGASLLMCLGAVFFYIFAVSFKRVFFFVVKGYMREMKDNEKQSFNQLNRMRKKRKDTLEFLKTMGVAKK